MLNKIQQELPGCPVVASLDHTVCLVAEHNEHRRLLRSHQIADADAKGAEPPFPSEVFLAGNRSTEVDFKSDSAPYSLQLNTLA